MCDPISIGLGVGGGILSSYLGYKAADKAADAQVDAAKESAAVQWQMYNQSREDSAPWREAGENALRKLLGDPVYQLKGGYSEPGSKIGAASADDKNGGFQIVGYKGGLLDGPGEYTKSPGYQYRLDEGNKNILARAAAQGRYNSGATDKALVKFGQDYATNDYDNFLARYYQSLTPYQSLAGIGQTTSNALVGLNTQTGNSVGNALASAGEARASGYINKANAFSGGINNALGLYAMTYGGKK
jgi:hypothetical protein